MTLAGTVLAWSMPAASATTIIFEDLPTNDSLLQSHHAVGGPILADDFVPAAGGQITGIDWWGTAAQATDWEIAFHTNDPINNQPNLDSPVTGAAVKYFVAAAGVADPGLPAGILHYHVDGAFFGVQPGTEYWFTVANVAAGWNWADALSGPTVGSENFNAHSSVGNIALDGGPHGGPWTDEHTDLAFRFSVPDGGNSGFLLAFSLMLLAGVPRTLSQRRLG